MNIALKGIKNVKQEKRMKEVMEIKKQKRIQLEEQKIMEEDKITKEKKQQEKIIVLQKELENFTPVELKEFYEGKLEKREKDIKDELNNVEHTIEIINNRDKMVEEDSYAVDRKRLKNYEDEIKKEHDDILSMHRLKDI
jgi:hypothetical protein